MSYLEEHKAKFDNLRASLDIQYRNHLKRKANGGNSIIFAYPPAEEQLYIEKFKKDFHEDAFEFIDIAKLLVEYINVDGWDNFVAFYNDFKDTPHIVFKSDDESTDLMDFIIKAIKTANNKHKTAVLMRTGALYGTGIENVHIMEHKSVMSLIHPLIIMYPSKLENDNLYFLNFKLASKYR